MKLIYGHDPLCGWCFGFIPALRYFAEKHPDIEIDVMPGGLASGDNIRSYGTMVEYISTAILNLKEVTGNAPSEAFMEMISGENPPIYVSAPPTHAILQMKILAPERCAEFTHQLQAAHFVLGQDLNIESTYKSVCEKHNFPMLDALSIINAKDSDSMIAASYARSAEFGVRSFPAILIVDNQDRVIENIQSIYNPSEFLAVMDKFIA